MMEECVYQEDMTILSVYGPRSRDSKYIKPKLMEPKLETATSIIIVGDSRLLSE